MALSTQDQITQFYKVLIDKQPDISWISNEAARVDSGITTLGQVMRTLFQSPSYAQSHSSDIVRLFYLTIGRAPDLVLHNIVMDTLRSGMAYQDVVSAVLTIPGNPLSNDGLITELDFTTALIARALGVSNPALAADLAFQLKQGGITRGEMVATVSQIAGLATIPSGAETAALAFLAGASREITASEMLMPYSGLDGRIIQALSAGGLSATAGKLAINRDVDILTMYSELPADFRWDVPTARYTLGGTTKFKVFYGTDKGLSGSVVDFDSSMVSGATTLDASLATGSGKVTFLGNAIRANVFKAPLSGSQATGGNATDLFIGNIGNDTFYITGGQDTLTGGLGDDRFVLPASTTYQSGGLTTNTAIITDFGLGKDTLDFSRVLNKSVDISKLTAVLATTTPMVTPANGSITLIDNDGLWTTGASASLVARKPTASEIAALFSTGGGTNFFAQPTNTGKFVIITADTRETADVWLILNSVDPRNITDGVTGPLEIFKIAELHGSWNPSLVGITTVVGSGLEG